MIEIYKKRIEQLTEEYQKLCLRAMNEPYKYKYYSLRIQEVGNMIEFYSKQIREYVY